MNTPEVSIEEQKAAWIAYTRREPVQWWQHDHGEWRDVDYSIQHRFSPITTIRRKPAPKLRPWKAEEVPLPCVLRPKPDTSLDDHVRWVPSGVGADGIRVLEAVIRFHNLLDRYEHSTDNGTTWKECGVEE